MALKNYYVKPTDYSPELVCDECDSTDVRKTPRGYVCACCGLVLKPLYVNNQYSHNKDQTYSSKRYKRTIGKYKFKRIFEVQKKVSKNNKERKESEAVHVMDRFISNLNLTKDYKQSILKKYMFIWNRIESGSHDRTPERIIPGLIFLFYRSLGINIFLNDLLEISKINQSQFWSTFKIVYSCMPEYKNRDRVELIKLYISMVQDTYDLSGQFFWNACKIGEFFWRAFLGTKERMIAAVISSIAVLSNYSHYRAKGITLSKIARTLNLHEGSVNRKISKAVKMVLKIPQFSTPVASWELIAEYLDMKGILTNQNEHLGTECEKSREFEEHHNHMEIKDVEKFVTETPPDGYSLKAPFNDVNASLSFSILIAYGTYYNCFIIIIFLQHSRDYFSIRTSGFKAYKGPPCYCFT